MNRRDHCSFGESVEPGDNRVLPFRATVDDGYTALNPFSTQQIQKRTPRFRRHHQYSVSFSQVGTKTPDAMRQDRHSIQFDEKLIICSEPVSTATGHNNQAHIHERFSCRIIAHRP